MIRKLLPALLLVAAGSACQSKATPSGTPVQAVVGGVPGLGAEVQVYYDSLGVPHVVAASDADAAYAVGYVQARDRFFQMDFMRKAARGRLAEMLGSAALSTDVSIRTVFTAQTPVPPGNPRAGSYRIEDVIAADAAVTPPAFKALLQRYADGVNRWLLDLSLGQNGALIPSEYVALALALEGDYTPAVWTVEDSIAIGRIQSWSLSETLSDESDYGAMAQAFARACGATPLAQCFTWGLFGDVTRFAPAAPTFILPPPAGLRADAAAAGVARPGPSPEATRSEILQGLGALRRMLGVTAKGEVGSNNWVTRAPLSAHPMVANDPHLSFQNPSVFYMMQVTTDTHDVGGVAFPGAPVIPIGHNAYVGWGDTVVGYDVTDVYYFPVAAGGLPATTVPVSETYRVRGGSPVTPAPIMLVPDYGPVVAFDGSNYYTARWTGQEPSNEIHAFYQLNLARSVDEAFEAVKVFQVGAQNFVFADVLGNIGYYPHAYVPVRKAGCYGNRLVGGQPAQVVPWAPMPGFDGSCVWTGRISDENLPQTKNPATNYVVTANNDITGVTAGNDPLSAGPDAYLYAYRDLGYRAQRATQLVTLKTSGTTLDDFTAIQADDYSAFAEALLPGLLAWFDLASSEVTAKGLGPAVEILRAWSAPTSSRRFATPTGLATSDPAGAKSGDALENAASSAAMLYHALLPRLAARILDPVLDDVTYQGQPFDTRRLLSLAGDQEVSRYLVALMAYAQGTTPPVPLNTVIGACGGTPQACASAAVAALEDTVNFLTTEAFPASTPADWLWGRKHRAVFESLLSSAGTTVFNYGPFANDGGSYTVDVANFSWNDAGPNGFIQRSGPNVRFSAEMIAPGNVSWRAVIPGGQPDYVQDPNYQSMIPLWLSNAPGDQPWTPAQVQAAAVTSIVFQP
ncbi:MAG TPA: penicillin acylase family protein [Anaeromyxobacteraceae bacterium]|nr:penicillin acylase family protein [Anaeromyxobacteraceae bacterium]